MVINTSSYCKFTLYNIECTKKVNTFQKTFNQANFPFLYYPILSFFTITISHQISYKTHPWVAFLLYRTNFPIKEQSGQVHFNSLNPSFMRDLLHFVCQMRVACLLQQYSLRIYSVRYFTKTRTSLSKICVCTSSGRVFCFIGRTFL